MSTYFVSSPIYYVNDRPHIGHIFTTFVVDTIARYRRLRGDEVFCLTGTDEHGQKIERAAAARGLEPIALADEVVAVYHRLWAELGISHDDFIRTTEARHIAGVREIVARIAASGDFYLNHHEGLYCTACEVFYTEKELLAGNRCPIHESACEPRSEQNLFFRLSKYQQALLDLYERQPGFIKPEIRANEMKQFVASGLRDLSVSRSNVQWGIPFPGHEGHTIYVWLDALSNYITALGFGQPDPGLYQKFWAEGDERVHIVGKDILRFHSVYWPAFLLSAGLPLPTTVWAHGFWLRDERKIAKSGGNIFRPNHLIERFGGDPLRYFLLREMVFGQDASFSDEAFVDRFNSDLANDLGNTLSRLVTVSRKAFAGRSSDRRSDALKAASEAAIADYRRAMDGFAFQEALRALWRLLQETNQYLVQNEPWKKIGGPNSGQVGEVLWTSCEALRLIAVALLPIMPDKAARILESLACPVADSLDALAWGGLPCGVPLPAPAPLFPRIDKAVFLAEISADSPQEKKIVTTVPPKPDPDAAPAGTSPKINYDQFMNVELRVAAVVAAERVPKSSKLLLLTLDAGEAEKRTVVAGIAKAYEPEALVGRQVIIVANLEPAKLMGVESNGMVLAASEDGLPILLAPERAVPPGTRVR